MTFLFVIQRAARVVHASAGAAVLAGAVMLSGCGGSKKVEPTSSSATALPASASAPYETSALVPSAESSTVPAMQPAMRPAMAAVDRGGSRYPSQPYGAAQAGYGEDVSAGRDHFQLLPFEMWTEEQAATDALGRIGPPAIPALIQALRSQDPLVRRKSAEVLARMGSDAKDAVPDLIRLLDDPDPLIRKTAARTLGRIGPDSAPAIPALMRTLMQPQPQAPR